MGSNVRSREHSNRCATCGVLAFLLGLTGCASVPPSEELNNTPRIPSTTHLVAEPQETSLILPKTVSRWEPRELASIEPITISENQGMDDPFGTFGKTSEDEANGESGKLAKAWARSKQDFTHFYGSGENLTQLALFIGLSAPLANTHADREVRDWYQQNVRNASTDFLADVFRPGGEVLFVASLTLGAGLLGNLIRDPDTASIVSTWGDQSFRALLVGSPALFSLQLGLGAHRPSNGSSYWHPFNDFHGASGHAFVGAVPFLTAASMTDNFLLRSALVAGSLMPGLSRINDDWHYLSQVALGWGLAFLATESVRETETGNRRVHIFPTMSRDGTGLGVMLNY